MAEADERARLRRQLGLTPEPTPVTAPSRLAAGESGAIGAASIAGRMEPVTVTPTVQPDERTRLAQMGAPTPTLTGAERAAQTIEGRKTRFEEELARREAEKPTEDPGPGFAWIYSVAEGRWKKVRTTTFGGTTGDGAPTGPTGPGGGNGTPTGPTGTGTVYTAPDGRIFTDLASYNAYLAQVEADKKRRQGQSAWNVLKGYLDGFGLGVLAGDIENYIKEGLSYEELLLKLRTESAAYKRRFSANAGRIAKGLRALSEAEYIALEDQYQNVMRRYGMPDTYYAQTTDPTTGIKIQQGFEKFIEGDISPVELEDRIQTAYTRVINAAPEVMGTLRQFYGELITNGDILAYALDTKNAIENIKRKVGAAEIGAEATQAGLATTMARAEELQRYGITQARAEQGFQAIADILPSATRLSEIYRRQGLGEYTQETAEQEAFGIPGAAEAGRKRRKLTELEQAQFAGRSGAAGGALARDRAGSI